MLSDAMKKATINFLREAKRLLVNTDSDEQKRLLATVKAFKEAKMKGVI